MKIIKVAVLRAPGTNCDSETALSFNLAGAESEKIHINEFISGSKNLENYHILAIPGGFAYGDYVTSGKILANQLKFSLGDHVKDFIDSGKLLIGICNGFQVLAKSGILPGPENIQKISLASNDNNMFQDRWVYLKAAGKSIFTKGIKQIYLPINHGEGKFVTDKKTLDELEKNRQIVLKYCDKSGIESSDFPVNPNGSMNNIAAVNNKKGNVFGMMPHPEKYMHKFQHPRWTREKLPEKGDGFKIFSNAVEYAEENLK